MAYIIYIHICIVYINNKVVRESTRTLALSNAFLWIYYVSYVKHFEILLALW